MHRILILLALLPVSSWGATGLSGGTVNLGTAKKTQVMKQATVRTASLAPVSLLSYTATAGTTFYLTYFNARIDPFVATQVSSNVAFNGSIAIFTPLSALNTAVGLAQASATLNSNNFNYWDLRLTEPIQVPGANVFQATCTPNSATVVNWIVNFGGYEK